MNGLSRLDGFFGISWQDAGTRVNDVNEKPHTGDVFWCESFPGLHGHAPKERYAIVISPPSKLPDKNGCYLVVPTSASTLSTWTVELPNRQEHRQTTSGLPSPCKAVCDEYKIVKPEVLTRLVGDLRTPMVARIQEVVSDFIKDRLAKKAMETRMSQTRGVQPTDP